MKIGYIVPEVGGTRFTPQNDRKTLLFPLMGVKMLAEEGNITKSIDLFRFV